MKIWWKKIRAESMQASEANERKQIANKQNDESIILCDVPLVSPWVEGNFVVQLWLIYIVFIECYVPSMILCVVYRPRRHRFYRLHTLALAHTLPPAHIAPYNTHISLSLPPSLPFITAWSKILYFCSSQSVLKVLAQTTSIDYRQAQTLSNCPVWALFMIWHFP